MMPKVVRGSSKKSQISLSDRKSKCNYCDEELHQDPTAII